jgi:DNA-binding NarL/FixJ family response regulator
MARTKGSKNLDHRLIEFMQVLRNDGDSPKQIANKLNISESVVLKNTVKPEKSKS